MIVRSVSLPLVRDSDSAVFGVELNDRGGDRNALDGELDLITNCEEAKTLIMIFIVAVIVVFFVIIAIAIIIVIIIIIVVVIAAIAAITAVAIVATAAIIAVCIVVSTVSIVAAVIFTSTIAATRGWRDGRSASSRCVIIVVRGC